MFTFFPTSTRSLLERLMMRLSQKGPMPGHIGYIMDGNRRYAVKKAIKRRSGHFQGLEKLVDAWRWHRELGITQATMYAFSIDNFKRTREEVDELMDLFREMFSTIFAELHLFMAEHICIRIVGRVDLLPLDIQQLGAKVVLATANNRRFTFNMALAYSAQEEMANAMSDLNETVREGLIQPEDINEMALNRALYTLEMDEPDILVRTSGEIRLSDFLLWQTGFSHLAFVKPLWPDFSLSTFFQSFLQFQLQSGSLRRSRRQCAAALEKADIEYCKEVLLKSKSTLSLVEFTEQRKERIELAIDFIRKKRLNALEDILKKQVVNPKVMRQI